MCRDYERERSWREHRALLDAEYGRRQRQQLKVFGPDVEPNSYQAPDTAPTDPAHIVRVREGGYGCELAIARWWFVPEAYTGTFDDFRKKENLSTFNARGDRIAGSPTFRKAFVSGRCLVPASGWYEWTEPPNWKKGKPKTKWRIMQGDHEPIFFAGISSRIENGGDPTLTFALVTHDAGPGVDKVHDRAPIRAAGGGLGRLARWATRSATRSLAAVERGRRLPDRARRRSAPVRSAPLRPASGVAKQKTRQLSPPGFLIRFLLPGPDGPRNN